MTFRPVRSWIAVTALCAAGAIPVAGQPGGEPSPTAVAGLAPTARPALPAALRDYWLVPSSPSPDAASPAVTAFARAVRLYRDGKAQEAAILINPAALASTPLAAYAHYYRAMALLALERYAEARVSFGAARALNPDGALRVAAPMGEARAAEALNDFPAASVLYRQALADHADEPDQVLAGLARADAATGRPESVLEDLRRLYLEYPTSELATGLRGQIDDLAASLGRARPTFAEEVARVDLLLAARDYGDARLALERLVVEAPEADRESLSLKLAMADLKLRRYQAVPELVQPYLRDGAHADEARYAFLTAQRGLKRTADYGGGVQRLVADYPASPWSELALNDLATYYLLTDEDEKAASVFREMTERFPQGANGDRAAWRYGWWLYRSRDFTAAADVLERAGGRFPRSDYRPSFLYWAGRAHENAGHTAEASARYDLAVGDYGSSYYGRLARGRLEALGGTHVSPPPGAATTPEAELPVEPLVTAPLVRFLLSADLYDDAVAELQYAKRAWGDSPKLMATTAWAYHRQGDLRRAITLMKRAYPQYLSEGDVLPIEIQRVLFPLQYWDVIRQHSDERGLDPYLVSALIAQESTFSPTVKSSANAYGLMQILPRTGRQLARAQGIASFTTATLTQPEPNVRLGTTLVARLIDRFADMHLVLASYNAGDDRVRRWLAQRPGLPADEFIEDIPFPETQNYVKKILGTAEDYRRLYGEMGAQPIGVALVARVQDTGPSSAGKAVAAKRTTGRVPARHTAVASGRSPSSTAAVKKATAASKPAAARARPRPKGSTTKSKPTAKAVDEGAAKPGSQSKR
ncbi:MAG: transglycosylase SLT domain-containing protein [Vicinamibacterales bacterium]